MSAVAEFLGRVLLVVVVIDVALAVVWGLAVLRLAFWRRRLRASEEALVVVEFEAITEIAARVRLDSPPITSEWLAEYVSEACEQSKEMGL